MQGQKAAKRKQQNLVTASLRGDDYLPPEVLSQLPTGASKPASSSADGAEGSKRMTKAEAKAAARRAEAEYHAKQSSAHDEGLPKVIRKSDRVEVAVLPEAGASSGRHTRLHAPVKLDAKAFLQQQLYGDRHKRVAAATLASQRASGGRFGAATNFATVPLEAKPKGVTKKGKRGGGDKPTMAGHSTLEQLAARIMRKNR